MHDARIVLKTGEEIVGPVWSFNVQEGYLAIAGDMRKLYFRDIESAMNFGQRTHPGVIEDVDLLERAKQEGWEP